MDVAGKRVLVVGLARSGRAAARCLRRRNAVVTVTDLQPPVAFGSEIRELVRHRVGLELGMHREETFVKQDLIVVSPGVFPEPPALQAARRRNIPVVPEVEAAGWFLKSKLVGITGSNGKTTTTALLGEILEASGFKAFVGGNIGVPLISAVDELPPDALAVTELSSFQLEDIRDFRPHVAVLLNLTPNHLDRHPSFEAYVRAKAQVFRNQTSEDYAILNADDPKVMTLASEIASRKLFFSRRRELPEGVFVSNGCIQFRVRHLERLLLETREIPLRGEFNVENVLAAAATACVLGADFGAIRRAVRDFRAVEHRLEFVREIRAVEFFNDSKATSVDATANALSAFERGVQLILGGKDKGAPYAPLRRLMKDRVRCVYVIGAAAERIARELAGTVEIVHAGDLETAVEAAFTRAERGDVVLLSPACASFDQFRDFEHRGQVFKQLVEQLAAAPARGEVRRAEKSRAQELASTARPERAVPSEVPVGSEAAPQRADAGLPPETPRHVELQEVTSEGPGEPQMVKGLEAEEAGEPSEALGEPPSPSEQPEPRASTVSRSELAYVYEVAAEEFSYPAGEVVWREDESVPLNPEDIRPPEEVTDEPLPFEVRAGAGAVVEGRATNRAPGDRSESASPGTGETKSSARPSRRQSRLPGI